MKTQFKYIFLIACAALLSFYQAKAQKSQPQMSDQVSTQVWISVTECGAKGDGITDDTRAIQSALDLCRDKGGGTVYFPRGIYLLGTLLFDSDNYHVSSALHVYSEETLLFERGATLKRASGEVNHMLFTHNEKSDTGYEGCKNIAIIGATVDENSHLDNSDTAFNITHGHDISITNCTFRNAKGSWHSIEVNSSRDVVISGCLFHDNSNMEDVQMDAAVGSGNLGKDDATGCQRILIENCTFHSDAHAAIGNHGSGIHRDIMITGCTFQGTGNDRAFITFTPQTQGVSVFANTFIGEKNGGHTAVELNNLTEKAGTIIYNRFLGIDTPHRGGGIFKE